MKNTKALCLIVLGSIFLAAGSAFAENVSYEQLKIGFDKSALQDLPVVYAPPAPATSLAAPAAATLPAAATPARAAAPAPAATPAAPPPAPKPTLMDTVKKFIGDNARNMLLGGIGAYIGFVLLGPIGLLIGGLLFLAAGTL